MCTAPCVDCLHYSVENNNKTMYKAVILIILGIIGTTCASSSLDNQSRKLQRLNSSFDENKVDIDLCPECIEESSCSALCGALANRTNSTVIGDLCDVVCEGLGIDEFVKLLIKADLDPIWYCELIDICPINDHGDAKFTNFDITPKSAPEGSTFVFDCSFVSVNGTGTGTINIEFIDPKNRTVGNLYWFVARKPGTYPEKIGIDMLSKLYCDSTKEVCDSWPIGIYNVTAQVCNGECGSHHPHSSTYDTAKGSFEITKKKLFF